MSLRYKELLYKLRLAFPNSTLRINEVEKLSSGQQELLLDYLDAVTGNFKTSGGPGVQGLLAKILDRG